MMIACPRCGAAYDIDAALFGAQPRVVQCSGCDWRWTQRPPASAPAVAAEESAGDAAAGDDADSWEVSPEPDDVVPEVRPVAPSAPDPHPAAAEEPPAEPPASPPDAASVEVVAEVDAGTADEVEEDPEEPPEPEEPASTERLAPAKPAPPEKRRFALPRGRGFVAGTTAVATVIAVASLLVVFRGPISSLVPATNGFYAMLGLAAEPLGAGLEIREISSLRVRKGGEDVLTVTGVVANVARHPVSLPLLRVSLYDAQDEELQFVMVPGERPGLDPGETLRFDARIIDPRPAARRVRVGFAPPPEH